MTVFLDLRTLWSGGEVSLNVQLRRASCRTDYHDLSLDELHEFVYGKDLLIGTHGFNVCREAGIDQLSYWESLLELPPNGVFLGLLWPGDNEFWHALSYPVEPRLAIESGNRLAPFLDELLEEARSVSLVSHSLGARVVLQTASTMKMPVGKLMVMAGAIEDNCLTAEYSAVAAKVGSVSVLASAKDPVLEWAFPLGNLVAELVDRHHPWWSSALGRFGPQGRPLHYQPPCRIPDAWMFGHGDYLQIDPKATAKIALPTDVPQSGPLPQGGASGWEEAWSASFVSTRFR